MSRTRRDRQPPVDTFEEMTQGAIGTRIRAGRLMAQETEPTADELEWLVDDDELDRLTDGDLSGVETDAETEDR